MEDRIRVLSSLFAKSTTGQSLLIDVSVGLTRDKGIHSLATMGYTGHEHIEGMDVVHMNGRIYDPVIGRKSRGQTP